MLDDILLDVIVINFSKEGERWKLVAISLIMALSTDLALSRSLKSLLMMIPPAFRSIYSIFALVSYETNYKLFHFEGATYLAE